MQTVLAVDDELSVRQAYRFILGKEYRVLEAENAEQALALLDAEHVDLILLDMVMPGMHGLEFLAELRRREEIMPVIVVTASTSVVTASEAMRQGAFEFLSKPFDVQQLSLAVERALREGRTRRELSLLRRASAQGLGAIAGHSRGLMDALARAHEAALSEDPVLIAGETGTGKRLLARVIHSAGPRAGEAFAAVSCAGPAAEVERELRGYNGESGAVDGKLRLANRGTLFLDEVGRLPPGGQDELLRVLVESRFRPMDAAKFVPVDIRLVAATSLDPATLARDHAFRSDLLDRISAVRIDMPPLRDRPEDIPPLTAHFLALYGPRLGARARAFSSAALDSLAERAWPGNVRELEYVVELLLIYHPHAETIEPEHLRDVLPRR